MFATNASLLMFALTAISCAARDGSSSAAHRNVLWITVDTLRADHLGSYGYSRGTSPAIDSLAARGVRFERAHTTAPWTLPAVVSMLTGELSSTHGVSQIGRRLSPRVRTAPAIMREAGYATGAVVSGGLLRASSGISRHFERWDDSQARGMAHVSTPGVLRAALGMLRDFARGERPFLLFVHLFDPHYQFNRHQGIGFAPVQGETIDGTEPFLKILREKADLTGRDVEFLEGLYDEEIRFVDNGVLVLLQELNRLELTSSTLVAVTADHGEEIFDHDSFGHTVTLYQELVHVPLIIAGPGVSAAGRVISENVSTRELGFALAELAGVRVDPTGIAALVRGENIAAGGTVVFEVDYVDPSGRYQKAKKSGVLRGDFKLILDDLTDGTELYDLAKDPRERNNLAVSRPEVVIELKRELEARLKAEVRTEPILTRELDDAELEELGGLGYVGD